MNPRRVVVTGLGALTPIGNTKNTYFEGLKNGVSGAGPITYFDTTHFKTKFACEVKNFDAKNFFDRKEARKMDRFTQYAVVVSDEAIADANLPEDIDKDRVGIIWGCGIGGFKTFEEELSSYIKGDGIPRFNPFFIPKLIVDMAPGMISMRHGFTGPNYSTVSACASSTNAIIDSLNYIRWGYVDCMITGGSEAAVIESGIAGFSALKAISERNDAPELASRPFDKDRDGFVLGEGAGALVLEEYEHAKNRGAKIYAEILGGGLSADAYHMTAPHPEGEGAYKVMRNALKDSGLDISDIDYINVHGTSTPLGDIAETKAIDRLFAEYAPILNISSTKSMTGHLLGAAGAIEAIASIFSIQEQVIPATINLFEIDPEINPKLNLTPIKAEKRKVHKVMSNTFGFGGHNSSIIFSKVDD